MEPAIIGAFSLIITGSTTALTVGVVVGGSLFILEITNGLAV